MKANVFYLFVFCFLVISCQNESASDHAVIVQKEEITIDNIGAVHNYLLDSYFANNNCITLNNSRNMDAFFNAFKDQLMKNDKYYVSQEALTRSNEEIEYFQDIMDLKIDNNFYNNARALVLKKIDDNLEISNEVKDVIHKITDLNISDNERFSLIDKYKSYQGGELLVEFKNIYISSSEYWQIHRPIVTRSSSSTPVILADGVGGLLGAFCSGPMGVVWCTAFSYVMDQAQDDSNDDDSSDDSDDDADEEDDNS